MTTDTPRTHLFGTPNDSVAPEELLKRNTAPDTPRTAAYDIYFKSGEKSPYLTATAEFSLCDSKNQFFANERVIDENGIAKRIIIKNTTTTDGTVIIMVAVLKSVTAFGIDNATM